MTFVEPEVLRQAVDLDDFASEKNRLVESFLGALARSDVRMIASGDAEPQPLRMYAGALSQLAAPLVVANTSSWDRDRVYGKLAEGLGIFVRAGFVPTNVAASYGKKKGKHLRRALSFADSGYRSGIEQLARPLAVGDDVTWREEDIELTFDYEGVVVGLEIDHSFYPPIRMATVEYHGVGGKDKRTLNSVELDVVQDN